MEQDLALVMQHINFGRLKEAEELCVPLLEKHPLEPLVLHATGLLAYKKMDFKEAIDQITKSVQIDKNNPLFFGNLGVKDHLQQDIAQFIGNCIVITRVDCINQFVGFFY